MKLTIDNQTTPNEIRKAGIKALTEALGPVGMAKFMQQFEQGEGDYTKEQEEIFKNATRESILEDIKKHRKATKK